MSFLQELKKVTIAQIPFNQVIPILSILRTTSSHTIFNTFTSTLILNNDFIESVFKSRIHSAPICLHDSFKLVV